MSMESQSVSANKPEARGLSAEGSDDLLARIQARMSKRALAQAHLYLGQALADPNPATKSTMPVNKKRPRVTPVSAEKAPPLQIDEDLLCLICTELVEGAKHVACCGALFCGACIDLWMNRPAAGDGNGQVCPQCRDVLTESNILVDVRSDRKSAAQPRRCPFHEKHDCDFVGTRQEVAEHKFACPCDPDVCTSQRCKAEKADLENRHAIEKGAWEARAARDAETIGALKKTVNESKAAANRSLVVAAWLSPEEILKRVTRMNGVMMVPVNNTGVYTIAARKASEIVTMQDIDIRISEANYNVSLFCHRPPKASGGRLPRLKVVITLITPYPTTEVDFTNELTLGDAPNGFTTWLTSAKFSTYRKLGKFAIGWTVTVVA